MKKFLLILILALSFQSWTNADNVKDFQIEGISVGDSLLNHFSKREINERVKITKSRYKDKSIVRAYFKLNKYDLYPILNIHFKDDNKLTVESISGFKQYNRENIKACYEEQKKVVADLKSNFPNIEQIGTVDKIQKMKKSGKGKFAKVYFDIEDGRIVTVCKQWDKSERYASGLQVILDSETFVYWLDNKAYK